MDATPRVNQGLLSKYVGQNVRLVGRVKEATGAAAVIEASDGGQVTVHTMGNARFSSQFIEVIGTVNPDLSLREMWSASFGDNFELGNYNELVLVAQKLPELF